MTHEDGLAATGLIMAFGLALGLLIIDLLFQKFIVQYKWILIIELIISAILLFYAIKKGMF